MYDFDDIAERRNTDSLKWNVKEHELPMWVADMDFKAPECIKNIILERLNVCAYGYSDVPEEYYNAFISFWQDKHNVSFDRDDMIFSTGVVPSLSSAVRALTNVAERVVILTPVYNIFFNSIYNNGRNIVEIPLLYNDGKYSVDYNSLENELKNPQATMLIMCNPHNPVGVIWSKEELAKIGHLCAINNVIVVSDEIHSDISRNNMNYNSFYDINDECKNNSIVLISASKAFNLAGFQASVAVIHNRKIYNKFNRELNTSECAEGNFFSFYASIAALNEGRDWLNEVNLYIDKNFEYYYDFINKNIKNVKTIKEEATYLAWLDVRDITIDDIKLSKYIRETTGLYISSGSSYGKSGRGFLRINLATSKKNVIDGLNRLKEGIELFQKNCK